MKNIPMLTALICATLLLTGCISREHADKKLAKACQAAATAFMAEDYEIKEIQNQTFTDATHIGNNYRNIRLDLIESDGWYDSEEIYNCIFLEKFAPFKASHTASIYQLQTPDKTYGKDGNKIMGTMQDIEKLANAVDQEL